MARRRHHRSRAYGWFEGVGPGVVTGAADDDPAGIGTYSQVGASLRFDLLWTALISLPLTSAVLELAARLGLSHDRGLAAIVRERFPKGVVYPVLGIVVLANTFNVGADIGSMAASLRLLVPIPELIGVATFAAGIAVLEVRVPYDRYSKILRWLVLSLVAYLAVLFSVHVPWRDVAFHTFVPHMRADREHIAALIAIVGTTISPYLFFWQAAEEMEEKDPPVTAREVRRMRIDVVTGVTTGVGVMFAILTATAVTLGADGGTIESAEQAAQALEPLAGGLASLLFTAGIVGTGLLAVPVLAGSSAYAAAEAFHWHEGLSKRLRQAPGFYGVMVAGIVIGASMNLLGINPIRALFFSAILNALAAPPILVLMLLAGRDPSLGQWRSGRWSIALVATSAVVMTLLPVWYLLA